MGNAVIMHEPTPISTSTLVGWLAAALATAWGVIVKRAVFGRMDEMQAEIDRKVDAQDCALQRQRDQQEHLRIDAGHNALNNKIDALTAELRGAIDSTRREIKSDLAVIVDLIKAGK